jgi:hypothetical protein
MGATAFRALDREPAGVLTNTRFGRKDGKAKSPAKVAAVEKMERRAAVPKKTSRRRRGFR